MAEITVGAVVSAGVDIGVAVGVGVGVGLGDEWPQADTSVMESIMMIDTANPSMFLFFIFKPPLQNTLMLSV
jgi:biotin synthase-related radical SAM superfamily protein